jgi:phosphatidate cytidylyltransferase
VSVGTGLRARVVMGVLMAGTAFAVLLVDLFLAPYYPCLLVSVAGLLMLSADELHRLAADLPRPPRVLCLLGVAVVVASAWPANLGWYPAERSWRDIASAFTAVVLIGFLWEMLRYRGPDGAVPRLALLCLITAYLGLLPAFVVQMRWWPDDAWRGSVAIALTIFVPKGGDIGAYLVGRWFGRTPMTPLLSPKKTWEGLIGGLAMSVAVAIGFNRLPIGAPLLSSDLYAALFGLSVGVAGVVGDLAESLIKRDVGRKDASETVPGFGGILDVIDSVLFAAPVAYWWLKA